MPESASQQRREARYRRALKACGFRSWRRANARRCELIDRCLAGLDIPGEQAELCRLQKLADLYGDWKTNDAHGRSLRRLDRLTKKLGVIDG